MISEAEPGSVAVEIAKRSGKIQVFAIEKKPLALELINKNREKSHCPIFR